MIAYNYRAYSNVFKVNHIISLSLIQQIPPVPSSKYTYIPPSYSFSNISDLFSKSFEGIFGGSEMEKKLRFPLPKHGNIPNKEPCVDNQ